MYSKRHVSIPFKEIFLIWNYPKNDLWILKMFSLNQFWWIIIIWINSLHNNNNIIIIIMIYPFCVIPTNVGQLLETKNDPQTIIKTFPKIHNNGSQTIQRNLLNLICIHDFKIFNFKKKPKNHHNKEGLKLVFG